MKTKDPSSNFKYLANSINVDKINIRKSYGSNLNNLNKLLTNSNISDYKKGNNEINLNYNFVRNKTINRNNNPISNYYSKNLYISNTKVPYYLNTEFNPKQFYKYNDIIQNNKNFNSNNFLRSSLDSLSINPNNYQMSSNLTRSYNFSIKK